MKLTNENVDKQTGWVRYVRRRYEEGLPENFEPALLTDGDTTFEFENTTKEDGSPFLKAVALDETADYSDEEKGKLQMLKDFHDEVDKPVGDEVSLLLEYTESDAVDDPTEWVEYQLENYSPSEFIAEKEMHCTRKHIRAHNSSDGSCDTEIDYDESDEEGDD